MKWNDLYIAGTGACLPGVTTVREALESGAYDERSARISGHLSVTVAGAGDTAPGMAVKAGNQALQRSGYRRTEVGAVLHSVLFHNGIDVWNSGSYIQNGIAAPGCFSAEVRSGSNGGLVAVELAAAYLAAHPEAAVAVCTAGDVWADPSFDRWRSDRVLFGDGAAAMALSRQGGFARIISMATYSEPGLEAIHRGDEPFGPYRFTADHRIDLNRRRQEFMGKADKDDVWKLLEQGLQKSARQALGEADATIRDMDILVTPHLGEEMTIRQCLQPLGEEDLGRTAWEFSRRTGHLGPADQLAGFNYLAEKGVLAPGTRVLLVGIGGGFTWTCAVVEVMVNPLGATSWHDPRAKIRFP
ncbi:ketoacyl-ACP synthase III family protein [Kitasatospora sp. NPDC101176]|uniref:ketoacyl-ACP synthase III family protein n=1 Tax=Kitasatospora sp. NPDC101176 TaxID=3364099 RepID=UPI0038279D47